MSAIDPIDECPDCQAYKKKRTLANKRRARTTALRADLAAKDARIRQLEGVMAWSLAVSGVMPDVGRRFAALLQGKPEKAPEDYLREQKERESP